MSKTTDQQEFRLETGRLLLRNLLQEDLDPLAVIHMDPVVMRFWPAPYSRSETQQFLERNWERYRRDGVGIYAALLRESGEVVGRIGYLRQWVKGKPDLEIGYLLAKECWGRGLATEAAVALRDHAFRHLSLPWLPGGRVERVISLIRPENEPSCRVAERNGMRVVDETEQVGKPHRVYAITREEWERVGSG